ncbi:hypothetical protein JAAARDRAFT_75646 [Jaapia argillacea MUCL 33604]|uniref:Uncharacterized protein n=1 Tax=Jaapia argillacea MUCL 33604 TaxID=933084 RepID=A0A067Q804_9AGAM|nr:hypothetical protein JAAARDRAFT_75646 [Jaapia argillacea MUCL 33604]
MSTSEAEYDAFDWSFTSEDYANIDAFTHAALSSTPSPPVLVDSPSVARGDGSGPSLEINKGEPEAERGVETDRGGPEIIIEIEGERADSYVHATLKASFQSKEPSPFERFRAWRHALSVSDLTGPAWCEVQFDYGLRQKRFKKLEDRPTSFVSAQGRQISVDKKVAQQNDKVLQRGQSVHKQLEQQIRPVEVTVPTKTEEERWALRLVNMLSCLGCLLTLGVCREMPVFGVLHGQLVTGIIDEIHRKPRRTVEDKSVQTDGKGKKRAPASPRKPKLGKKARRTPESDSGADVESQAQITSFFSNSTLVNPSTNTQPSIPPSAEPINATIQSGPSSNLDLVLSMPPPSKPNFTLVLLDTKTRRSPGLPSHDDTLPSRLQLMLYHSLLSPLISASFDFSIFWASLGLDSKAPFSERFIQKAMLILPGAGAGGESSVPRCLDQLVVLWVEFVKMLNVDGVDPRLTLVYRTQAQFKHAGKGGQRGRETKKLSRAATMPLPNDRESQDLARAIAVSLTDGGHIADIDLAVAIAQSEDPQLAWAIQQSLLALPEVKEPIHGEDVPQDREMDGGKVPSVVTPAGETEATMTDHESSSGSEAETLSSSKIIGTKDFLFDDKLVDDHLTTVLGYWYGQRPPTGVDVMNAGRCRSCEYCDGCEWRETKALEAVKKVSRSASDTSHRGAGSG